MAKSSAARKKRGTRAKDLGIRNGLARVKGGMIMKDARPDKKIVRSSKDL